MKFFIFIFLVSFTLNEIILDINDIISVYDNFSKIIYTKDDDFKINNKNIKFKLLKNDIFDLILQSENSKKQEIITLKCNLYSPKYIIKCYIKDLINLSFKGSFYLNEQSLEKSFKVNINEEDKIFSIENAPLIYNIEFLRNNSSLNLINNYYIQINCIYKDVNENISISYALDDGFVYPTIVSITSIMENVNSKNIYNFYIMHPGEFTLESKNKLKSFENKYENCYIYFIDMKDQYKKLSVRRKWSTVVLSTPTYYRLSLQDLLPNIDKIIYIDGDVIALNDIKIMYDIDMEGYYFKGYRVWSRKVLDKYIDNYLCAGVLLINLKELRKNNIGKKFSEFITENSTNLTYHDETIINYVCTEKNGILNPKFGFIVRYKREEGIYSKEEKKEALKDPVLIHLMDKPWEDYKALNLYGTASWWKYAKKTSFYKEIIKKYPIIIEPEKKTIQKKKISKIKKLLKILLKPINIFIRFVKKLRKK